MHDERGARAFRPCSGPRCVSSSPSRAGGRREPFLTGPTRPTCSTSCRSCVARGVRLRRAVVPARPDRRTRSASSFATRDVRLTTRYAEHDLHGSRSSRRCTRSATASTSTAATPRSTGRRSRPAARSALHESQSRLWENVVGRSLPVLALVLPAVPRRRSANVLDGRRRSSDFHRAINRAAAVADPGRRRRDDLQAPHHPPLRARAGAARRLARDEGPARGVEREARGAPRRPPPDDRLGVPPGRRTGRAACSATSRPTARQRPLRADLGAPARRPSGPRRADRARRVRRAPRLAARAACTATAASSRRRRRSSGSRAARSTPSRTSATCADKNASLAAA